MSSAAVLTSDAMQILNGFLCIVWFVLPVAIVVACAQLAKNKGTDGG